MCVGSVTYLLSLTCVGVYRPCDSGPCQNGGTCKNHVETYTCTCLDKYTGTNCESGAFRCVSVYTLHLLTVAVLLASPPPRSKRSLGHF